MQKIAKLIKLRIVQHLFLILISFLIIGLNQSCMFYNRMASPKVLDEEERAWTVGAVTTLDDDLGVFNVQPVVSYRTGLKNSREFGATLYGVYFPGLILNLKKNYTENNNRYLTGDFSFFGGVIRPFGLQYDLIYGSPDLYGGVGVNVIAYEELSTYMNTSFGWEFGEQNRYGLQLGYSFNPINYDWGVLSIGFKMDFVRIKKKYRE